jgi:signal transduction histidine kinase
VIKRLRLKIIIITLLVLLAMFVSVVASLNIFMWSTSRRASDALLSRIVEMDGMHVVVFRQGSPPEERNNRGAPGELFRAGRFFYVKLDHAGKTIEIRREMMFDFSQEEADELVRQATTKRAAKGNVGSFQYLRAEKEYGTMIVFVQRNIENNLLRQLITVSLWAAGGTCVALLLFTLFFSQWAVAPVQAAFDKQRRFISDASHELKTPLTILNANADLLRQEIGENSRVEAIQGQSERLRRLIHDLLTLARADEGGLQTVHSRMDLSQTVLSAALAFESRAFEEGRTYEVEVDETISVTGDAEQLKRLVSILIDNALVHSNEGGTVRVRLEGGEKPVLSVANTGDGITESEREKIFERFYRTDASRARATGGYGLGLAIAKSIAEAHRATIAVEGQAAEVRFTVCFRGA